MKVAIVALSIISFPNIVVIFTHFILLLDKIDKYVVTTMVAHYLHCFHIHVYVMYATLP